VSAHLPPPLQDAIAHFTRTIPPKDVASRSAALTETYRGGARSESIGDERDVAAYLATRLPSTYAAVAAFLNAIRGRRAVVSRRDRVA
jgi:ribosomal protein RSM22 (predicted rRNA methylase)